MNAVIYPVYFHRNFERRWATRMAEAEPRRLRREGTDTCECGNVVGVPRSFGHLPIGITHENRGGPRVDPISWQSKRRDIHDPAISESQPKL